MKILAICTLLMVPLCSYAETHLILHIASKHSKDGYTRDGVKYYFNEQNLGLGVAHDLGNHIQARAGFYENSLSNTALYVGGSFHTDISKPFAIGTQLGVASGYQDEYSDERSTEFLIMALPFIQLRYKRIAVEVGYVPPVGRDYSLTTLSMTFRM